MQHQSSNIQALKARQVRSWIGKLIQREGEDQLVSEMFYLEVVQPVLLLGDETCLLLAEMAKTLEEVHMGLLCQVTGKTEIRQWDGTWRRAAVESVLKEAGT